MFTDTMAIRNESVLKLERGQPHWWSLGSYPTSIHSMANLAHQDDHHSTCSEV